MGPILIVEMLIIGKLIFISVLSHPFCSTRFHESIKKVLTSIDDSSFEPAASCFYFCCF